MILNVEPEAGVPIGKLIEYDRAATIFNNPTKEITRKYVEGCFG